MSVIYPVLFTEIPEGHMAYVPDLEINTHGKDLAAAISMARDAISLWCVAEQDMNRKLPNPTDLSEIECRQGEILTLVDADIDAYRSFLDAEAKLTAT